MQSKSRPFGRLCFAYCLSLVAVEQHALLLLFADRAVEEAVALEVDLDERRPRGERSLDERFRERIFDVALDGATQRTRAVAAVGERLVEDPLARIFGDRDGDVPL